MYSRSIVLLSQAAARLLPANILASRAFLWYRFATRFPDRPGEPEMKPPALSLDAVTALPLVYRQTVPPEYEDHNGHMNVRWYLTLFDDAGDQMVADLFGITIAYHRAHGTGGFDLEHHLHYLREVHIRDTVAVYTRIVARSPKRLHYLLLMVNETRQTLAATLEVVNSFADLTQRRTAPFPPEIAARIDALLAEHTALDWEPPVCGVMSA